RHLVTRSALAGVDLLQFLRALEGRLRRLRCQARGLGLMAGFGGSLGGGAPGAEMGFAVLKQLVCRGFHFIAEDWSDTWRRLTPARVSANGELNRAAGAVERALTEWDARL